MTVYISEFATVYISESIVVYISKSVTFYISKSVWSSKLYARMRWCESAAKTVRSSDRQTSPWTLIPSQVATTFPSRFYVSKPTTFPIYRNYLTYSKKKKNRGIWKITSQNCLNIRLSLNKIPVFIHHTQGHLKA